MYLIAINYRIVSSSHYVTLLISKIKQRRAHKVSVSLDVLRSSPSLDKLHVTDYYRIIVSPWSDVTWGEILKIIQSRSTTRFSAARTWKYAQRCVILEKRNHKGTPAFFARAVLIQITQLFATTAIAGGTWIRIVRSPRSILSKYYQNMWL